MGIVRNLSSSMFDIINDEIPLMSVNNHISRFYVLALGMSRTSTILGTLPKPQCA